MNSSSLPARRLAARLDPIVYTTPSHVVHVILCTRDRSPALAEAGVAQCVAEELVRTAAHWGSTIYCYCIMPDHIHTVITPGGAHAGDLRRVVGSWKAAVTRSRPLGAPQDRLWQRGFWDHVLREEEDVRATCEYVLANPVRRGLVARWEEWPFSWLNPAV